MSTQGHKFVYSFGVGRAEGRQHMKDLLGSKGAGLAEMAGLGLPVPAGFTLTTQVCRHFMHHGHHFPPGLEEQVQQALKRVEQVMGASFGDPAKPLLLSVRSGAPVSMPGMMDTVLNIGLNPQTLQGLVAQSQDPRFAHDCYRRFVQMYASVVMGAPAARFEHLLTQFKAEHGIALDAQITVEGWQELIALFEQAVVETLGEPVPHDPQEQLWRAIRAVFLSWDTARARAYRRIHDIPDHLGTAVNVMAMVFGNMGQSSASGVAFTRNPATGERRPYGEFLPNAQGEDVVAGTRTPWPLCAHDVRPGGSGSLEQAMPAAWAQLLGVFDRLEKHYREMQDIEFTIENANVWILQTRTGKRTGQAAIKIALDMVGEGLISASEAVLRIDPLHHLAELLHPRIDPHAERPPALTRGLSASPGAATGQVVFTAEEAVALAQCGQRAILVRASTSAEDIHGMHAAQGILTQTGGMTSHAAVVARSLGKPCICAAGDIAIARDLSSCHIGGHLVPRGAIVTLDATLGEVYQGALALTPATLTPEFRRFLEMSDAFRRMQVRANADSETEARRALDFGAQGIGLVRTEHMFFQPAERLRAMRAAIVAHPEQRARALEELEAMQQADFEAILRCMDRLPVTVRLLDPPLHEFFPKEPEARAAIARELSELVGESEASVRAMLEGMGEENPMLGWRGVRLGLVAPDIYLMQVRALAQAGLKLQAQGLEPHIEIMLPLVCEAREVEVLGAMIREEIARVEGADRAGSLRWSLGTMIELPRAALVAAEIARHAMFFSFGTNDLTQATLGMSRDDAARFLPAYLERGIFRHDPFASIDPEGVGALMGMALDRGRKARPGLEAGICGEHAGDPRSIALCEALGLDYVSCSAFRVPVARLAAAQAALRRQQDAGEPRRPLEL